MPEHLLFLTGKLAENHLRQVLEAIGSDDFSYSVHQIGVSVAALMTADMIRRRLKDTFDADRVIVPGRCLGDLDALSNSFGIPFQRGPKELKDLPEYFGKSGRKPDLSRYKLNIFAEITDAPHMTIDGILQQARTYKNDGADVIDIGCLPNTPFPHLEDTIIALKSEGFRVSIDSLESDDLLAGGKAGADFLLSLHENSLWVADEIDSIPVLIPAEHGNLDSLDRAVTQMDAKNKPYLLDPILDPIHFGFADSLARYLEVRKRNPNRGLLMGVGNLTELTHADTAGMNALLLGICSELKIDNILTTQVSQHACKAIKEADQARRIMYASNKTSSLPKHFGDNLMALHECAPFPYSTDEITELADQIRDPSYRIQTSEDGIHIYNREGINTATDPFDLFPKLDLENDSGHAFYLGVQLGRAQIAWQLGKRFVQDEPLQWGCAVDQAPEDLIGYKEAGTTLKKADKNNQ